MNGIVQLRGELTVLRLLVLARVDNPAAPVHLQQKTFERAAIETTQGGFPRCSVPVLAFVILLHLPLMPGIGWHTVMDDDDTAGGETSEGVADIACRLFLRVEAVDEDDIIAVV